MKQLAECFGNRTRLLVGTFSEKPFLRFSTRFLWCSCVLGSTQISSGRLQHAGVNLCGRRGVGYRRGRPHCLLRRTEEPHPPRAANGPHWSQAAGPNCCHSVWGTWRESEYGPENQEFDAPDQIRFEQTVNLRVRQTYNQSQSNKRSVYKSITGNKSGFHLYPNSPRMLPQGLNPTLHKMHITCGQFDHQVSSRRSVRGRRSRSEGRVSLIHPQNLSEWRSGEFRFKDVFVGAAERGFLRRLSCLMC